MVPHASYLGAGGRAARWWTDQPGGYGYGYGATLRGGDGPRWVFWWRVMGMGRRMGHGLGRGGERSCISCLAGPRGGRSASSGCTLPEAGLKAAGDPPETAGWCALSGPGTGSGGCSDGRTIHLRGQPDKCERSRTPSRLLSTAAAPCLRGPGRGRGRRQLLAQPGRERGQM